MSIYLPHYQPNKGFMKSSIKKIVEVMQQEAKQEATKNVTCHQETCTQSELTKQATEAEEIYSERFHQKLNGDGWNLTDIISIKLGAIPHVYDELSWEAIKDEFVHLIVRL